MSINISSLPTQLMIGGQNWSQYISFSSGIQIGYPEYAMGSGLMIAQGTINLEFRADFAGLPSSPVYKLNPNQWRRGQTISIAVNNVVLPCSGGQLFLLKSPQYPNRDADGTAKLSLSVGCRLALESFPPEPSRNVAGVMAGQPTNRDLIISRILNYINVSNALGSIPYAIDYSMPKTDGNWIQFAGKIADSAGHYLRCRTDGLVVSEPIQLSYGASARGHLIGRDEKMWEAIGDVAEQPLELTIVTGVVKDVTLVDRSPQVVTEVQPAGALFPDLPLGQQNPTFPVTAKAVTKTSEKTSQFYTTTEVESQTAGVLFPDLPFGQQNPTFLVISKRTVITYTFTNGIVASQKTVEQQTAGALFPDLPFGQQNPTFLVISKTEEISWISIRDGVWQRTYNLIQPAGILFPDLPFGQQNPTFPVTAKSFVDDKDTSGPPTNIGDVSDNLTVDRQIKAEVYAIQLAEDPYRPRQRTIDVPYAVSVPQLSNYGALINRMLTGRAFGWLFGGVLDTGLLPFQQVAVTFEGLIYYLRVDAFQYSINGTEAYLLWNGIEVGTAAALTPNNIIFPLQIPLGVAKIESISGSELVYDTLGTAQTELISGGNLNYTPPLVASGLNLISGSQLIWDTLGDTNLELISGSELIWNTLGDTNLNLISGGTLEYTAPSALLSKTIVYYKMDEASGTRNDSHTNSRNLVGSAFTAVSGVTGLIGDCYPSSQSPVINNPLNDYDSFDLNIVSFLGIAFWFYPNPSTSLLFRMGDGDVPCQIDLQQTGYPRFSVYDSTGTQYSVDTDPDGDGSIPDQWNLIIIEINTSSGNMSIQLNNDAIITGSSSSPYSTFNSGAAFKLGQSSTDELFFYNAPLTTGERTQLWNSGAGTTYPF